MINRFADMSQRKAARVAGLLYLLLIIFGVFAQLFVRSNLIVWGDATATANNIIASGSLFRLAFLSDMSTNRIIGHRNNHSDILVLVR